MLVRNFKADSEKPRASIVKNDEFVLRAETIVSPFTSMTANSTGSVGTPESLSSADSPNFSNQLTDESSPSSSSRALLQSDDASMSDSSSDHPQQVKSMEADLSSGGQENTCGGDNR